MCVKHIKVGVDTREVCHTCSLSGTTLPGGSFSNSQPRSILGPGPKSPIGNPLLAHHLSRGNLFHSPRLKKPLPEAIKLLTGFSRRVFLSNLCTLFLLSFLPHPLVGGSLDLSTFLSTIPFLSSSFLSPPFFSFLSISAESRYWLP